MPCKKGEGFLLSLNEETKGLGSRVIIDSEGHIPTNYHVAGEASKLEVVLAYGSRYPAKLVGEDSKTDLAVIHISAKERLPHVTFGDSDKVEVEAWVVAIGPPRALNRIPAGLENRCSDDYIEIIRICLTEK